MDAAGPTPVTAVEPEPGPRNTPRQYLLLGVIVAVIVGLAIRGGSLQRSDLLFYAVLVPSIILHEVSHGAVALRFGDPTAQRAGRLTLNPIKHIDPFWTVILPAMMVFYTGSAFGMAKPVPVNPGLMRSPRNHGMLTALAGPAVNIVLAAVSVVVLRVAYPGASGLEIQFDLYEGTDFVPLGAEILFVTGLANTILAAFNLLPIPPLDGSSVPERLLPVRFLRPYLKLRQYSFFLFIGLFLVGGDLLARVFQPAIELWAGLLPT